MRAPWKRIVRALMVAVGIAVGLDTPPTTAQPRSVVVPERTAAGAADTQSAFGSGQDPLAGSRVFAAKGCVKCHAISGVGGAVGPDLARIPHARSFYDLATALWNHLPHMAERMQQFGIDRPQLDVGETRDLIAFLYTLNYFDPPGDAEAGRRLFAAKACIACHQVRGTGGTGGPTVDFLRHVGSPMFIAATLWNHGPRMSETMSARGIERPSLTGRELGDLLAFLTAPGPPVSPIYVLPGRPDVGRRLFTEKRCVECHAVGGEGAQVGPDLAGRDVRRKPLEFAAAMWNKAPGMTAAMQLRGIAVPELRADQMADLVAYLYGLRYFAEPGDVRNGWAVATYKGCLTCHAATGERGRAASDLSRITGLDSPAAVIAALWNHAVVVPPHIPGAATSGWPEFRPQEMADLAAMLQALGRLR
jgi:mono/diheme cytochrome c family protein